MGNQTLTNVTQGVDTVDAVDINNLNGALNGHHFPRGINGIPNDSRQDLGQLTNQWRNLYLSGDLVIDGESIDIASLSQALGIDNYRVKSGRTTALDSSGRADYLRAGSSSGELDILANSVDLELVINGVPVVVQSNITVSGLTGFVTGVNASVNEPLLAGSLTDESRYMPEENRVLNVDNLDAEWSALTVGKFIGFECPDGDYGIARWVQGNRIGQGKRGYLFDASGNITNAGELVNNDTIILHRLAYVFLDQDGVTVDITYLDPVVSGTAPISPVASQYWFDVPSGVWRRYSGTAFIEENKILLGYALIDTSNNVVATRSIDFAGAYRRGLVSKARKIITSTITYIHLVEPFINVYGTEVDFTEQDSVLEFNRNNTAIMGGPPFANTDYYLYVTQEGDLRASAIRPKYEARLLGYYHPFYAWRCIEVARTDGSANWTDTEVEYFNKNFPKVIYNTSTGSSGYLSSFGARHISSEIWGGGGPSGGTSSLGAIHSATGGSGSGVNAGGIPPFGAGGDGIGGDLNISGGLASGDIANQSSVGTVVLIGGDAAKSSKGAMIPDTGPTNRGTPGVGFGFGGVDEPSAYAAGGYSLKNNISTDYLDITTVTVGAGGASGQARGDGGDGAVIITEYGELLL